MINSCFSSNKVGIKNLNLFNKFFDELNKSKITYGITGCTELYPDIIHSDIDIIVDKQQFGNFWKFMKSLRQHDMDWIQVLTHEITAHYFIITFSKGESLEIIKPDVCTDYYRGGNLFLKADRLLKGRVFDKKGFYRLSPKQEFIYYLLKKIDKCKIDQGQFSHLLVQWKADRAGCELNLREFFSETHQQNIIHSLESKELYSFQTHLQSLRSEMRKNLQFNVRDFLLKGVNRMFRLFKPTGLVVVFMGPDGAGKTTIITGVKASLTEAFRKSKQFHLFPKEGNPLSGTLNPHEAKPRGYFGSLIKLFYLLGVYLSGYCLKIYPLKVKSTLIIFDRYYHDIIVDPLRYRHGAGIAWLKIIGLFVPQPDLWIMLDAPAGIIQRRKSEVPEEETSRQLLAYKKLFSSIKNAHIVNANQQPERVIYDVSKIIIEFMKQRTAKRYKSF